VIRAVFVLQGDEPPGGVVLEAPGVPRRVGAFDDPVMLVVGEALARVCRRDDLAQPVAVVVNIAEFALAG
jgi:hypothetical protein